MQCLPFSEEASRSLTKSVMLYKEHPLDVQLYKTIRSQTEQLLYALPSYLHLLDEEDCCEFFFYCYDAIDYFLSMYREGRLSYLGYLVQVVKKRSRFFISQKSSQTKKEQLLAQCQYYEYTLEEEDEVVEQAYYHTSRSIEQTELTHLPQLFLSLLQPSTKPHVMDTEPLRKLKTALQRGANRKRFLIVLSVSPDLAGTYLLEDLASLLDVEEELLSRYLNTACLMLEKKQQCKTDFEALSNRHFRRLLEIESELEREADEAKRAKLESLRQWTQRVYKAKVEQIRGLEFNLSHSQIGSLLNVPKGTVDSSVHYMKRLISQCLDET